MAKLNLDLAKLNVDTFPTAPEVAADDRYDSSNGCDTIHQCSMECLVATNVCRLC